MTSASDILQLAARFIGDALRPFLSSVGSDGEILAFVAELGWSLPSVPPSIPALGTTGEAIIDALTDVEAAAIALEDETGDGDALGQALVKLVGAVTAFALESGQMRSKLTAELPPDFVAATGIADAFQTRLFQDLAVRSMTEKAPLSTAIAALVGFIDEVPASADPAHFQTDYTRRDIRLDRVSSFLSDPRSVLKDVYGWGTPALDLDQLFTRIERVSYPLLGPIEVRYPSDALLASTAPGAPISPDDGPPPAYTVPIYEGGPITIVLALMPLPKSSPEELQGVALTLELELGAAATLTLGPQLTLTLDGTLDLSSGVAAVLRPDRDATIVVNPEGSTTGLVTGKGGVRVALGQPGQPARLLTIPGGSFLEAAQVSLGAGVDANTSPPDIYLEAVASGGILTISTKDADGFVAKILPPDGITAHFDFGVSWSHRGGLRFTGSGGLKTTFPVNVTLGPFTVQSIYSELSGDGNGITLELSANGSATIGPIHASIERFGIVVHSAFHDGNLGPVDLGFGFKPPTGAGLSIDAAGVSGGGFLGHDPVKHEYSGMLQLEFSEFALQAFGLITTQIAGGSGYSLIALIDANFPPIQLGWGFTLNGVGGLLGLNRTASTEALQAALKADTLSTILFPTNAIANAPQILGQLDAVFPPAEGRFLFGPMAQIGWGTPTLLTVSLAIVIELPQPIRLVLLARLALRLPTPTEPLVRINMDALGILDLGKSEFSLDATLYDSRLLSFALSGDMALRATWGSQREFLLAIGGFHPRFSPPPGFPALKRITIDMPSGIVSTLRLQAYFAVTSNTLQFGASLDVFIGVSGFGVAGHMSFDALLQLDPFHFDADISGSVALTMGGDNLMSVGLDAALSGPAPWHIAGSFKFSILFWDVHVSFSQSWGEEAGVQQIEAVDVAQLLGAILGQPHSWGAQLPEGMPALVTARRTDDAGLVAHPLARLEVHEQIVPLGLDITRFGAATPSGAHRFDLGVVSLGGSPVTNEPVEDDFAPAQFFDLSDEEKLARPSFERHDAGVRFGFGIGTGDLRLVSSGRAVNKEIVYETSFIDTPDGVIRPPKAPVKLIVGFVVAGGAADRAAMQHAGRRKYSVGRGGITVAEPKFVVADANSLAVANVGPSGDDTYSDIRAALDRELARNPQRRSQLEIVGLHEVGA